MGTSSIPVDLFNPGQVFACLGLMEMVELLGGGARGRFDWSDPTRALFHLVGDCSEDPLHTAQRFISEASVTSLAPPGTDLSTDKWSVETATLDGGFPMPLPNSPATLPARLRAGDHELVLGAWGDGSRRDNMKFWAGSGGYPGVGLLRDALDLIRAELPLPAERLFDTGHAQSSSFRFDWRRDYVPLQIGFSLNQHSKFSPQGFPLVEILALIGTEHARALRPDRRDKLVYRYAVLGGDTPLPLVLHRAALGCAPLPFARRLFTMHLDWPGQEGQARCITHVTEETLS